MSNRPPGNRLLAAAVLLVLALRLLAAIPSAASGGPRLFLNQTIPTRTPTPGIVPTRPGEATREPRERTPRPSESPLLRPTGPTPASTQAPGPESDVTPEPAGPDSSASPVPGATQPADLPGSASPPGAAAPGALPEPTLRPAAQGAARPTLPPWTPMVRGLGAGAGPAASCLWPLAGLFLIGLGAVVLAQQSRQARRAR